MIKEYYYRIAGFNILLDVPETLDIDRLLPSFRPFRCGGNCHDGVLFRFMVGEFMLTPEGKCSLVEESFSDLGDVRLLRMAEGYRIEIRFTASGVVHYVHTDSSFTHATASLNPNDSHAGEVLCSMLRIVFSQAVLCRSGISLHAAAVAFGGKAYLFMGKSGTGKSTHAALWLRSFPESRLLNDDNPTVRIEEGRVMVYGTPWSGKTPCYQNESFTLGGIVRLVQAGTNRFISQKGIDAFITILPGCMVIHENNVLHEKLCSTLVEVAGSVPVGVLECRPDEEAARLCAGILWEKVQDV